MILRSIAPTVTLFLLLALTDPVGAQGPSFDGLGQLPDGTRSAPLGVNIDGAVVVGYGANAQGDYEAFRWTRTEGMTGLGFLDPEALIPLSTATCVSAAGDTMVGCSSYGFGFIDFEALIWYPDGTMTGLGFVSGPVPASTQAGDVSADGSVIVGVAGNPVDDSVAFRWTPRDGMVSLGDLPGGLTIGHAEACSDDGTVVVGSGAVAGYDREAFRWTAPEGMVGIGVLPGYYESEAYDVSGDGLSIVGYCNADQGMEAFRWTESEGMVGLGLLPGGLESMAYATNGDGSIVVGLADSTSDDYDAFIWTAQTGMRKLRDVLRTDVALDLGDWHLYSATAMTPDGKCIVGEGTNPAGETEGWIVYVGDEPPCTGDLTDDGRRDLADLAVLLASYGVDAGGDLDDDGDTDLADLSLLLAVYGQACVW